MALGRSNWDTILDILAATFPGCIITGSADNVATGTNLAFASRGLAPSAVASYVSTYASLNPILPATALLAANQVFHDNHLLDRAVTAAAPFHRKWVAQLGDFAASSGVVLLRQGTRQLTLEVRYSAQRQAELRPLIAGVLSEAAQHFERAFEIASRTRFSGGRGYLEGVVADLPFSVFFVSEDMRIHYSNVHGEALRRQHGGPFSSADGILRAADERADHQLRTLVERVTTSKRTPTSVQQISLGGMDERYFAIARLALRGNQHYQLHDAVLDPGPLVMLIIHGSLEMSSLPTDLLWRAFSLTESEARLAEALLNGATLADFAKEREVSKQTLRNQLVGVMRKTGTRRQSELVSLLTRLALTCL
ncbi:helix-turn-helix transcriptional regulator [Devosia sp. Root105]|uniref:helix-turn-helix transcriptional regulator n=2 Tax=Devosia TaxID=46913 RepID=UPI0012E3CD05|nr:helix-turn-helix transcriptional regulator [Devosia sp. Root105]